MHQARRFVVMVALALGMTLGAANIAYAQATPAPPTTPTAPATTEKNSKCAKYVGLSNRIVMCLRETLDTATDKFYGEDTNGDGKPDSGFFKLVSRAITGFLTLAVIIYGILAAYGMLEKPGRDVMLLMVKLSLVVGFVVQSDAMYKTALTAMDNASAAVVRFAPNTGEIVAGMGANRLECINNMVEASKKRQTNAKGEDRPNYSAAWVGMDCVIDTVIGIKVTDDMNNQSLGDSYGELTGNRKVDDKTPGMARGLINFFFSSMQSSIMGILLAIIGFIFVYTLVWLVLKAMFVYLAGYIGIAFMMIFAPVFIPLVLFRVTSEYFKKWVKLTIAFALQPVIILAFVTFAVSAIDFAVFSGDYSVMYRIAGNESRGDKFNLNTYMDKHELVKRKPSGLANVKTSTNIPEFNNEKFQDANEKIQGVFGEIRNSDCGKELERLQGDNINADPKEVARIRDECGSYAMQWWRNQIDWEKMAKVRNPAVPDTGAEEGDDAAGIKTAEQRAGRTIAREVFAAVLFATLAVLCINGLLTVIPSMVNDLVGESFQSPNLFAEVSRSGGGGGGGLGSFLRRKGGG